MAKRYQNSFVSEDFSAVSNLPTQDKIVTFSSNGSVMETYVNNGMSTIDEQINADQSKLRSIMDPKLIS